MGRYPKEVCELAGNMLPVGLALSGGTAKAVTHVGIIKALVEAEIPIDYIAATSGGSMVGAFYASGMPISSILQVANNLSWSKLIALRFSRLGFVSSKRIQDFVTEVIGNESARAISRSYFPQHQAVTGHRPNDEVVYSLTAHATKLDSVRRAKLAVFVLSLTEQRLDAQIDVFVRTPNQIDHGVMSASQCGGRLDVEVVDVYRAVNRIGAQRFVPPVLIGNEAA